MPFSIHRDARQDGSAISCVIAAASLSPHHQQLRSAPHRSPDIATPRQQLWLICTEIQAWKPLPPNLQSSLSQAVALDRPGRGRAAGSPGAPNLGPQCTQSIHTPGAQRHGFRGSVRC